MSELKLEQLVALCAYFIKTMTLYLNFYLITYILTLLKLNYLLMNNVFLENSKNSLSYLLFYIIKFTKLKSLIYLLFLSLTGLPPFLMFFIKFNYLINLLYKLNIIIILCIFLIFFFNMIFYIQIFLHKNVNISIVFIKLKHKRVINFINIYRIVWFILFNFLSIFLFSDFLFVFSLIIYGNI